MLDQRRRRWADVLQMLYKYFVFAEMLQKQEDALCHVVLMLSKRLRQWTNGFLLCHIDSL